MIRGLGSTLDRVARRWMPDPFLLAVLLTLVVAAAAVLFGNAFSDGADLSDKLVTTVGAWKAFIFLPPKPIDKALLYFAFQMCLMLVTGHALASSPPVARVVQAIARLPRTFGQQVVVVAFTACGMALIHWGLGLIVGAMIAREVGRQALARGIPHHYPLLGACGYTGLMIWGGGLSGSIPLKAVKPFAEGTAGVPLSDTLFSSMNFTICGTLLLAIPLFCLFLVPRNEAEFVPFDGGAATDDTEPEVRSNVALALALAAAVWSAVVFVDMAADWGARRFIYAGVNAAIVALGVHRLISLVIRFFTQTRSGRTPAEAMEGSELVVVLLCAMALGWLEYEILKGQFKLSFNNLNYAFLFLGLLFQGTPIRYVRAVGDGARGCAGIILQFPLYFGILGIMVVTGLGAVISAGVAELATETTYPIFTYFSAGLVNLFVPSGGGQWVVQGRIVIEGAAAFPDLIPKSVLALTYGDAWTNMLQPFWAVPLLAITGLRARDIIGYTATVMILGGALTIALLIAL